MEEENKSDGTTTERLNWQNVKSRRNLYLLGITFMLIMSSYHGILGLESSINVEEGLGTISVMVIFITSAISCVTLVPCINDFFGAKTAIIVGEIGMMVYIAANVYPNWYTIVFASIFHGLTESAPWCGTSVYVSLLGKQRWIKQKNKDEAEESKSQDSYVVRYFGRFYMIAYLGDVLGFALATLVLMAFKSRDEKVVHNNTIHNNIENTTNFFSHRDDVSKTYESFEINLKLAKCGAKDCQSDYIYNSTEEQLENYNPDPTGTYVLIGLFVSIALIGVILQALFLTPSPAKFDVQRANEEALLVKHEEAKKTSRTNKMLEEIRGIFLHLVSPQHLLVVPLLFYYGLNYSFSLTEYTRAFVSCTVGVEKVGFALALFAISAILSSVACPALTLRIGRKWFVCVMGVMHAGSYIVCLFWIPNQHNLWVAYAISVLLGLCDGMIVNLYQGMISKYFEKNLGVAYSVQNLVTNLGIVASTSWGARLCCYVKLYIQLGSLAVALLCVVAAEVRYKSIKPTDINTQIESE